MRHKNISLLQPLNNKDNSCIFSIHIVDLRAI